jgi:hypothetical protein
MPFLLPGVTDLPTAMTAWGDGFISLWWTQDHFDIVTFFANGGVEHISHVPRGAGPPAVRNERPPTAGRRRIPNLE